MKLIENIIKGTRYIVNSYRTAPLGATLLLGSLGSIPFNYDGSNSLIMPALGVVGGALMASNQFKLRNRIEKGLANGYDDRVFDRAIKQWCGRQSAKIAAENKGHLDQFLDLIERKRDMLSLPDLRHL